MTDDPNALRPGASIAGYNMTRVLGAGGFGITYEAESPFTGKRVAIKEFFPRGIASRGDGTRFVYAARDEELVQWALKRFESSTLDQCKLKHPNIVDVVHYVKENGTGYMIMEYVEGETLEHWLRSREFLPTPDELRPLIEPVLKALEYLHGRRMIHRDIAPDNIMVRADGTPVIIDFGAIKLIERETQLRSDTRSFAVMKQFYSPPEQIQADGELDHRADIYSLGAVLYRAFSGRPPASAEERMQKLAFGKEDPYSTLALSAPHVIEGIVAAIDRALSFNAEGRQSSASEFRTNLTWDDEGEQTVALPRALQRDEDDAPRRSRLPWLIPLCGIAAIALVAVFAGGVITLPKFESEVVQTPPPKLEEIKEVPQMQVKTEPDATVPKQDGPQQVPGEIAKRYTGDVSLYRVSETNPDLPLTTCVPGRRSAFNVEIDGTTLQISHSGNTVVVELKADGSFSFQSGGETGGLFSRKMNYSGKITSQGIEGEFTTTTDRGTCYGKISAKPVAG